MPHTQKKRKNTVLKTRKKCHSLWHSTSPFTYIILLNHQSLSLPLKNRYYNSHATEKTGSEKKLTLNQIAAKYLNYAMFFPLMLELSSWRILVSHYESHQNQNNLLKGF